MSENKMNFLKNAESQEETDLKKVFLRFVIKLVFLFLVLNILF